MPQFTGASSLVQGVRGHRLRQVLRDEAGLAQHALRRDAPAGGFASLSGYQPAASPLRGCTKPPIYPIVCSVLSICRALLLRSRLSVQN